MKIKNQMLLAESIDYTAQTMKGYLLDEKAYFDELKDTLSATSYGITAQAYIHSLLIKMEKAIAEIIEKEKEPLTRNYDINGEAGFLAGATMTAEGKMFYPMILSEDDLASFCRMVASTFKDNLTAHISEEIKEKDAFITDDKTDDDVITICNHIKRMLLRILEVEERILNEELLGFNAQ